MKTEPMIFLQYTSLMFPVSKAHEILQHLTSITQTYNGETKEYDYALAATPFTFTVMDQDKVTAMLVAHKMEKP